MRTKRQRVRLRDIAEKVMVAESTVSKVLAGKTIVSEETRDAIFAAAEELGYRTVKKPAAIGLIVGSNESALRTQPFVADVLQGVEQACRATNTGLMYAALTTDDSGEPIELPLIVQQQQIQGVLVVNIYNHTFYEALEELNIPYVVISHYVKRPHVDIVVCDDEEGGYLATKYLLEQGHQNPPPAILTSYSNRTSLYRRYLGYRRALDEFGVTYDPRYVHFGENSYLRGLEGVPALFQLPTPPTAIFCGTDIAAIYALEELQKRGIKVPEQCSLVGFDDTEMARHCSIPLTTIHADNQALGVESVRFLLSRMEEKDLTARCVSLSVRLVERQSVQSHDVQGLLATTEETIS